MKIKDDGGDKPRYTYVAKGKYWRFRHPETGEIGLPGKPGSIEFETKYAELVARIQPKDRRRVDCDSFNWLLDTYFASESYRTLTENTRYDYAILGNAVREHLGDQSFRLTTKRMIMTVRDSFAGTPYQAEKLKRFISRLYTFAAEAEIVDVDTNPASGIRSLKWRKHGFEPWSDEEIDLLLKHARGVTRTLIIISIYTGQRPGDVAGMQWSQALGDMIRVRQIKTGELVLIPCHPALKKELERLQAAEGGQATGSIAKWKGRQIDEGQYRYLLRKLVRAIRNMPHRTPHGARFAAAARLSEAGCTVDQIVSIIGHRTYQIAMMYIMRRKNAEAAMRLFVTHEKRQARAKKEVRHHSDEVTLQ
jgi:integrase